MRGNILYNNGQSQVIYTPLVNNELIINKTQVYNYRYIDQPTHWTVPTGGLIYPSYIWFDTTTCDVTGGSFRTLLVMANQHCCLAL